MPADAPFISILFDEAHGQSHWSQTGFTSRQRHTNFIGLATVFERLGGKCDSQNTKPLDLSEARMLVVPPPTGKYSPVGECWRQDTKSLFSSDEICQVLEYLRQGGRLMAFAYRFGDSFTQTNLGQLFAPLGCLLNDDAIVDLERVRTTHPLQSLFVTEQDLIPLSWAAFGIERMAWRYMATFTLIPGAEAKPLVYSPGGSCVSYNRTHRQITFQSLPIAVAGLYGRGRFVLFGGPHAFETGTVGLLHHGHNTRFLERVIQWLLSESPLDAGGVTGRLKVEQERLKRAAEQNWQRFCEVRDDGQGEATVAVMDRLLQETGTLRALGKARYAA
jgi:hypothetical protein